MACWYCNDEGLVSHLFVSGIGKETCPICHNAKAVPLRDIEYIPKGKNIYYCEACQKTILSKHFRAFCNRKCRLKAQRLRDSLTRKQQYEYNRDLRTKKEWLKTEAKMRRRRHKEFVRSIKYLREIEIISVARACNIKEYSL